MSCGFDKGLLAAYYDGEADAAERADVERHAASCPECARDLADMRELSGRLKGLGPVKAPASLASAVAKEISPRRAASAPRRWLEWSLTAAAALLLAVGTVMILDRSAPEQPVALARPDHRLAAEPSREEDYSEDDGKRAHPEPPSAAANPAPLAEKSKESAGPPVLVVSAIDPSKARAEVEAFLKERGRPSAPPKDRYGKDDLDLTPYLEVELTEEETRILEARLRKLESVDLAKSTMEAEIEKDRTQAGLALKDRVGRSRVAEAKKSDDAAAKAADAEQRSALKEAPRRPMIFVFRKTPKK